MMNLKRFFGLLITLSLLGTSLLVPSQTVRAASIPLIDLRLYPAKAGGTSDILGVNGTCTLRKAIYAINTHKSYDACPADATTNTILLPVDPIYLSVQNQAGVDQSFTGDLNITTSMTIMGTGPNSAVGWYLTPGASRDVASEDRVFDISNGAKVNMSGFTIFNGTAKYKSGEAQSNYGGGIRSMSSELNLQNMTLYSNYAGGAGGGVSSTGVGAKLTMSVVNVIGNYASGRGGGYYDAGVGMIVENSFFSSNTPSGVDYNNQTLTQLGVVNNTTFSYNGGYGLVSSGSLVLSYLTVVGNTNYGIFLNTRTWTDLRDSILSNNGTNDLGYDRNCYRGDSGAEAKFVDGGYNIINPAPSNPADTQICSYNNGDPATYQTLVGTDPALSTDATQVAANYTLVYTFDSNSPVYNYHVMDPSSNACISPALPADGNPYAVTIPALPGNDQYLGRRPTYLEADQQKGCDTGAYELEAYLSRPKTYIPSIFSK